MATSKEIAIRNYELQLISYDNIFKLLSQVAGYSHDEYIHIINHLKIGRKRVEGFIKELK